MVRLGFTGLYFFLYFWFKTLIVGTGKNSFNEAVLTSALNLGRNKKDIHFFYLKMNTILLSETISSTKQTEKEVRCAFDYI